MQTAAPVGFGLVAVILGLDIDAVKQICETTNGGVWVANDNAPGQVVISGERTAVETAMESARTAGAKRAMALPLSVPVHCPLMEPAVPIMRDAIMQTPMNTPIIPIISNQTCEPMSNTDEIRESLVYQITHGVRWRESVMTLKNRGVKQFIEIGPGNVLTGLVTRITPELNPTKMEI